MTADQTQLFNENLGVQKVEATEASKASSIRPQHTLQDYLPQEALLAMKVATEVKSIEELRQRLGGTLPQNSAETRKRYVESIFRWFFRDGHDGFASTVWRHYQSTELQLAIHRYLYLTAEPIMGTCVASVLSRLTEGIVVPADYLGSNTGKILQQEVTVRTQQRLVANLRKSGFLERAPQGDKVATPAFSKTALLLAFHHAFNIGAARSIEFATLAANPFWRYVGLRSEDALRDFLKEAEHAGLLGKYVVADRLEQVTTCHSLAALIEKGVTL